MKKNLIFVFLFFFLYSCSFDTNSEIWNNKKKRVFSAKLKKLNFNENLSYEDFKKMVANYGLFSEIPEID